MRTTTPKKSRPRLAQRMGTLTQIPLALVVAAMLLGPLSCGDGTTEPAPPTPPPPLATTLTVSPETAELAALGANAQLSAQVFDQNGGVMTGQTVTWSSSNDAVATIAGSGLVTAEGNGTATITATAGTASGTATVTVAQEVASPLELAPDTASLGEDARLLSPDSLVMYSPGVSARLLPVGTDANGNALEPGAAVTWSSSDAEVATVDSTGLVTAVAVGAAVVTVTSSGSAAAADGDGHTHALAASDGSVAQAAAAMNVLVSGVTPAADTLTALDDTVRLAAKGLDTNGNEITGFAWSSDADSVATVDTVGLVTAVANGTATITATAGEFQGTAEVTVSQQVAMVNVLPPAHTFAAIGDTVQLGVGMRDANGHPVWGTSFTFFSSPDSVATVNKYGVVTAKANGTATITVTADSASGAAHMTVSQVVDTVEISPPAHTFVTFGEKLELKLVARDANGHPVEDAMFAWSSDNNSVATVNSGVVTAVANGEATITAATDSVSGTARVTVSQEAATVDVSPPTATLTAIGDTIPLTAVARDVNRNEVVNAEFIWSSDNDSVAAVDTAGLVTAKANGTATITATADSASGTVQVTVSQVVATLKISPRAPTLEAVGDTVTLTPVARDANGHEAADAKFAWSSDNNWVATVNVLGLVTAVGNGTATVTATTDSASGSAWVTVGNYDRAALVALYEATTDPRAGLIWSRDDNWLTDAPLKDWYGVGVDDDGRVTSLDLNTNRLSGNLPPELGLLSQLEKLILTHNQLTGPIPSALMQLQQLAAFDYDSYDVVRDKWMNDYLCLPPTDSFREWMMGIVQRARATGGR